MQIRLTDTARAAWLRDDERRIDAGRDKSGNWKAPPRMMNNSDSFEVQLFETPGRCWVKSPNPDQGYAPLMRKEWQEV